MRFPQLLFVLTGTGQVGFDNRVDELQMHAEDRHVARMLKAVPAAAASLEAIQQDGPNGKVWYPLADPGAEPLGFHELGLRWFALYLAASLVSWALACRVNGGGPWNAGS
ncbi:hypothetical protein [Kitasatospora sp. NPDC059673]|uniref:hypothetical protein n=1 Tax=Kitasatospora sp. NPDC059673 TaxID=3346901 RepID=UPI0036D1F2C4